MNLGFRCKVGKLPPIPPLGSVVGWKEVLIQECFERLVPLGPFSEYSSCALQDSIYAGERTSSPYKSGLEGSLITPFVREGMAKRLAKAASLLPRGYMFLIWDAYRSLEVQQALFDYYVEVLLQEQGLSREAAIAEAQKFVSLPSTDPKKPSPHNTGAVVDLTIVRFEKEAWREMKALERRLRSEDWQTVFATEMRRLQLLREQSNPLDTGTRFDEVSIRTSAAYYEQIAESELSARQRQVRENRRLLYYVMSKAGFSQYEEEWWHFSYGDQFWAVKQGVQAIYGAVYFSPECEQWEAMRRKHHLGCQVLWEEGIVSPLKIGWDGLRAFVQDIVRQTGDPRFSRHPKAAKL